MRRSPYHLVEPSPWPILSAMSALSITMGLTNWFHFQDSKLLLVGMMSMVITMMQWWRDIIREAMYMGKHTNSTQKGLRLGMLLFIISEICFFTAFFWAFFHSSLTPTPELGCIWPPMGIHTIDPLSIPLLNTAILLSSGISVTLAHHSLLSGKRKMTILSTMLTILLGMYFSMLQLMEYLESMFTIADSVYGSTFFVATGFHGAHVLMGTLFLFINLTRMMKSHFSKMHHFSFEAAAWYWHFVDVVWICLFMCIYWWGSL